MLLTVPQVAKRTGLSAGRIRQLIRAGILPAAKLGRDWAINPAHLRRLAGRTPGHRAGQPCPWRGKKINRKLFPWQLYRTRYIYRIERGQLNHRGASGIKSAIGQMQPNSSTQTRLYKIIDGKTGEIVGKPMAFRAAHRKADRLDSAYGACRYIVQPVIPYHAETLLIGAQSWEVAKVIAANAWPFGRRRAPAADFSASAPIRAGPADRN
jgi:excisionase family DNA binding protein